MVGEQINMENVYVILVAYKNIQYLDGCIGSLFGQGLPEERIIVVDNDSPYGEAEYIKKKWPNIHVIRMENNMGFSKANNSGMRLALSLGAEYCLLLNLDTVVCDGMVDKLVRSIPSGNNGISTARIYATKSRNFNRYDSEDAMPWYTGGSIDRETFIIKQQLFDYEDTAIRDVEFASGCCMLMPKEVIEKVGFLDEDYFLYYEDVDYCLRLRKMGLIIRYNPEALLWHAEGGSQRQEKRVADYYLTRNRLLCIQKHMDMFGGEPYKLLKSIIENEDYFRGYNSKRAVSYEKKAVEDFINGTLGQMSEYAYYFGESFEKETCENNKETVSVWSTDVSALVLLCNYSEHEKYLLLEFGIDTEDSTDTSTYTLYLDGKLYRKKCAPYKSHKFVLPFHRMEQHRLTVVKDMDTYVERESDGVPLFFRLNNFQLQEYEFVLESGTLRTENIGETECDRHFRWNWILAERADIVLANPFSIEKKYRISFNTFSPIDQKRVFFSINGEYFEEEVGKEFIYELAVGSNKKVKIKFEGLDLGTGVKSLSLIDFKWELIENFLIGVDFMPIIKSPSALGFAEQEQKENQYWNWIVRPQAKLFIRNVDHLDKVIRISFRTFSACDRKFYTLSVNGVSRKYTVGEEVVLNCGLPSNGELVLRFSNMGNPVVLGDGMQTYISVINFMIEEMKEIRCQMDDSGKIVWRSHSYKCQRHRICFNTFDLDNTLSFEILSRGESFVVEPKQLFTYEIILEKNECIESRITTEDSTDIKNLLERICFLVAEIDSFEESADCQLSAPSNYIQGFGEQEHDENSYWNWIVRPQAKLFIRNVDHLDKVIRISFRTFSACDRKSYTLSVNGVSRKYTVGEDVVLNYGLPSNEELVLCFSNMGNPVVLGDGMETYISVINFMIEEMNEIRCQMDDSGKIVWRSHPSKCQRYRIFFNTLELDNILFFEILSRGEYFIVEPQQLFTYEIMLEKNERIESRITTEDPTDIENLLERVNFLVAEIDSFEESADCQLSAPSNYIQGFGEQEHDEKSYWNWIVNPEGRIVFHNTDNIDKRIHISFNTFSVCDNKEYILVINGEKKKMVVGDEFNNCYELSVGGELCLCFKELGRPFDVEDGRKLYLSILDFNAEMSEM